MITSGSAPAALPGGKKTKMADFGCEDHAVAHASIKHPDGGHKNDKHMADSERGAAHPAHHTKGKMPSQLNPDHGPHK